MAATRHPKTNDDMLAIQRESRDAQEAFLKTSSVVDFS
jgi:hypothetical protein